MVSGEHIKSSGGDRDGDTKVSGREMVEVKVNGEVGVGARIGENTHDNLYRSVGRIVGKMTNALSEVMPNIDRLNQSRSKLFSKADSHSSNFVHP